MTESRDVLVTGACGYLGSQLVRDLGTRAADGGPLHVRLLDNLQSGETSALMNLPESASFEFLEGDILDPSVLRLALREVDTVVHLAAVVHTPLSFEDPNWVEQVNHWGTAHLIEACLSADVSRFVFPSSGAVYGPGGPFEEDDPSEPVGAYAHSKQSAETAIRNAADRGLEPTILRCGTLFGPAPVTRFDAVANKFARFAGVRKPLTIYGEGEQKRPFVHVRDASDAIVEALNAPETYAGETVNIVGENASVLDIAEAVRAVAPETEVRYTEQDIRTHLSFELDGTKAEQLGWEPRFSLQGGLAELVGRFTGFEPTELSSGSGFDI